MSVWSMRARLLSGSGQRTKDDLMSMPSMSGPERQELIALRVAVVEVAQGCERRLRMGADAGDEATLRICRQVQEVLRTGYPVLTFHAVLEKRSRRQFLQRLVGQERAAEIEKAIAQATQTDPWAAYARKRTPG